MGTDRESKGKVQVNDLESDTSLSADEAEKVRAGYKMQPVHVASYQISGSGGDEDPPAAMKKLDVDGMIGPKTLGPVSK